MRRGREQTRCAGATFCRMQPTLQDLVKWLAMSYFPPANPIIALGDGTWGRGGQNTGCAGATFSRMKPTLQDLVKWLAISYSPPANPIMALGDGTWGRG